MPRAEGKLVRSYAILTMTTLDDLTYSSKLRPRFDQLISILRERYSSERSLTRYCGYFNHYDGINHLLESIVHLEAHDLSTCIYFRPDGAVCERCHLSPLPPVFLPQILQNLSAESRSAPQYKHTREVTR